MVIREPIVAVDEDARRLVWIADFLPDDARGFIRTAMGQGAAVMKTTLDRLAEC